MSGFAALMALSATQTKQAQTAVQSALQQRQRNEEIKRKKQEEQDKKERELQAKIRTMHFEEEKKQKEMEERREADERRKAMEKQRREEEQRKALLYGPKKAKTDGRHKLPSSHSGSHEEVRRRRIPSDDEGGSRGESPSLALTREEKRQRRVDAEMRRTYKSSHRSHTSGYSKAGRRLPGGAIDVTSALNVDSSQGGSQSVKARIAALPNTLTRLNVNKRDTRTIDEILQDRAKAREVKVLDGDDAREFNDWFGKSKKKDVALKTGTPVAVVSAPSSGANSPFSQDSAKGNATPSTYVAAKKSSAHKLPSLASSTPKGSKAVTSSSGSKTPSIPKLAPIDTKYSSMNSSSHNQSSSAKLSAPPLKTQTSKASASSTNPRSAASLKKRNRSSSFSSASPPPSAKRRAVSPQASHSALSAEIWKLFGKDRGAYVQRDVLSDDEDMEADASALEKEELRSSRIAKKEEELALEEERRHEEEKRRKKRERELKEKRGQ